MQQQRNLANRVPSFSLVTRFLWSDENINIIYYFYNED